MQQAITETSAATWRPILILSCELTFVRRQEEYIKDEQRNLKKEYLHAQEEVKRIQSVPLVIGELHLARASQQPLELVMA